MRQSSTRRSIWLGAAIAPLAGPLAFAAYAFGSVWLKQGMEALHDWPAGLMLIVFFGLPIAYLAMFLLGVPYLLWLQRHGRLGWLSVCSGAVLAGGMGLPLGIRLFGGSSQPYGANLVAGAVLGLVCGAAWCAVTGPNNSSKPTPLRGAA